MPHAQVWTTINREVVEKVKNHCEELEAGNELLKQNVRSNDDHGRANNTIIRGASPAP